MWLKGLTGTLAIWTVFAVALRLTVAAPHVCPPLTLDSLDASARAAAAWIERNQFDDGSYRYEYDASRDLDIDDYNEVRHAGVTMSLYQAAAVTGDLSFLDTADRGLDWMIANLYRHDDWAGLASPRTPSLKLGASALMLAGLALRREATGDASYDELMREVGRFLLVMQRQDGSFLNYWEPWRGAPNPDITSRYATGEAFWALAMMHRHFPGEGWDGPARAVARYLALSRDEVEGLDFPPWADQWAAYGLSEMATWPPDDDTIPYARSLAERFGFLVRIESQRSDNVITRFVHGRATRAAGMGTWVEGLTSLWRLASIDPRMADMEPKLAERAICGAAILVDRQVTPKEALGYPQPSIAEGAWFTNDMTRMDDQQHALSGLVLTRAILASREEDK
ncbi:MAG: hypothetical protein Kow0010_03500 [Dehalococcoidia bacterium]